MVWFGLSRFIGLFQGCPTFYILDLLLYLPAFGDLPGQHTLTLTFKEITCGINHIYLNRPTFSDHHPAIDCQARGDRPVARDRLVGHPWFI